MEADAGRSGCSNLRRFSLVVAVLAAVALASAAQAWLPDKTLPGETLTLTVSRSNQLGY